MRDFLAELVRLPSDFANMYRIVVNHPTELVVRSGEYWGDASLVFAAALVIMLGAIVVPQFHHGNMVGKLLSIGIAAVTVYGVVLPLLVGAYLNPLMRSLVPY